MLESLAGKVLAGLVSFTTLFLSSYTGNEPTFKPIQSRKGGNYLQIKATLSNAFENDFSDVFKCGKPINIMFKTAVKSGNAIAWEKNYRHTVSYDPMNASWQVYLSETNQNIQFESYRALLNQISTLECSIPIGKNWQTVELSIEARLPKITMEQEKRQIDLMMLWKFKRPVSRSTLNLRAGS